MQVKRVVLWSHGIMGASARIWMQVSEYGCKCPIIEHHVNVFQHGEPRSTW